MEKKKWSPKAIFWTRFIVWCLFACIIPICFIAYRFDLFTTVSKISIGGWGLIVIIIFAAFLISLIQYVRKGMKPCPIKWIISGLLKTTVPLLGILAVVYLIKDNINLFFQVMCVITSSETIAVFVNPMPKWLNENIKENKKDEVENIADVVWDKFFEKKGGN